MPHAAWEPFRGFWPRVVGPFDNWEVDVWICVMWRPDDWMWCMRGLSMKAGNHGTMRRG
jgi:hypothetical protein